MANHTPGPWTEYSCEVQATDGTAICEMLARPEDCGKRGRHHADANSRLICAAPDLLAALMAIHCLAESPINPAMDLKMVAKKASTAIAKARVGE